MAAVIALTLALAFSITAVARHAFPR